MTQTRECRGCGGTGQNLDTLCGERGGAQVGAGCTPCETIGGRCLLAIPCPVCLGSGKVEDRIGREDAMADAETALGFVIDVKPYWIGDRAPLIRLDVAARAIFGG
jgi:hypothetical protein